MTYTEFCQSARAAVIVLTSRLVRRQIRGDLTTADYYLRIIERAHPTLLGVRFQQQVIAAARIMAQAQADQADAAARDVAVLVCGPDAGEPTAADLAEPEPELVECPTCDGSGIHYEDHGQGMIEQLGCHDCSGVGFVPAYMLERSEPIPTVDVGSGRPLWLYRYITDDVAAPQCHCDYTDRTVARGGPDDHDIDCPVRHVDPPDPGATVRTVGPARDVLTYRRTALGDEPLAIPGYVEMGSDDRHRRFVRRPTSDSPQDVFLRELAAAVAKPVDDPDSPRQVLTGLTVNPCTVDHDPASYGDGFAPTSCNGWPLPACPGYDAFRRVSGD